MLTKKTIKIKLLCLISTLSILNSCASTLKFSNSLTNNEYIGSYKGFSDKKVDSINLLVDEYIVDEYNKVVTFYLKKKEKYKISTPVYSQYNVDVNPFFKLLILSAEFFIGYYGTYQLTKSNNTENIGLQIGAGAALAGTDLLISLIPKKNSSYSHSINQTQEGYETNLGSSYIELNNKVYYTSSAGQVKIPFNVIKNISRLNFEKDGYVSHYYNIDKLKNYIYSLEKPKTPYKENYSSQIPSQNFNDNNKLTHRLPALNPGKCGSILNWVNTTRAVVFSIKESKRYSGKSFKAFMEGKEVSSGYTDYVIMYSQNASNITIETQMFQNGSPIKHNYSDFGRMQINLADYFCFKGEDEIKKKGVGALVSFFSRRVVNEKQAKMIRKISESIYSYGTSNNSSEYITNQISDLFFEFVKAKIFFNFNDDLLEAMNFSKGVAIEYNSFQKYFGEHPESSINYYCGNYKEECKYIIK